MLMKGKTASVVAALVIAAAPLVVGGPPVIRREVECGASRWGITAGPDGGALFRSLPCLDLT